MYEIGKANEGTESMFCIQACASVETWLQMSARQDGWNMVKGNVGGGRSYSLLWDVTSGDRRKQPMGDIEVIVFGRFLLDFVPIKLNKFNGIGGKMLVETAKCGGGRRDIDGRAERKGKERERKRLLHYGDQLLGTVSYGVCCTKCHVALLHWDSVLKKWEIINYTESKGKESQPRIRRSIERTDDLESLEREKGGGK